MANTKPYVWAVLHRWGDDLEKASFMLVFTETSQLTDLEKVYFCDHSPIGFIEGNKLFAALLNAEKKGEKNASFTDERIIEMDSAISKGLAELLFTGSRKTPFKGFIEILVIRHQKVSAHADSYFVIHSPNTTTPLAVNEGLPVFSDKEQAQKFLDTRVAKNVVIKEYSWNEIVDLFGTQYQNVVIDPTGTKDEWYCTFPLKKDVGVSVT